MGRKRAVGLKAILLWKGGKGALELAGALFLLAFMTLGEGQYLDDALNFIHDNCVREWSARLADHLLTQATPHHIRLVFFALAFDAAANLAEWWCLWRAYPWAEWFVAATAGSLLPFEVYALLRRVRPGRVLVLLVNSLIVLYLILPKLRKKTILA